MNIADMKIGNTYSFTMQTPIIHGSRIQKAKLTAVAVFGLATMLSQIEQQYAQIHPALPQGTPYTPDKCTYYVFTQLNGERIILADQWIVEGSVEEVDQITYRITIHDGALGDAVKIRAALTAIGKMDFTIES